MDYAVIMDKVDTLSKPMMYKSLLEGTLIVKKQKHFKLGMLHLPHLLLCLLRLLLFHLQLPEPPVLQLLPYSYSSYYASYWNCSYSLSYW